jgi:uncharacterized protein (DUF169 family)
MKSLQTDLSIYRKFNFESPPVGVRFLRRKPEGIERLPKTMALCEMINEAQHRDSPFYIDKDNEDCAGGMMLGMVEPRPHAGGGELGVKYGIFEEARVNERLAEYAPKIPFGTLKYILFAPLEKITFQPDLLFLLPTISQAEILLRALSYSTGEIWSSKMTSVGACAWMFVYPYQSGKVNYIATGLTFGLKAKKVYPEGRMIFSIPYDWIPVITRNLEKMEWVLPSYTDRTRKEFMARRQRIFDELDREYGNQ